VIAGLDPWDIVDEAWSAIEEGNFSSKGPVVAHAVVVARNKAVDFSTNSRVTFTVF
jgi:hypothetical protein